MIGITYLASWPRSGNTLLRAILWQCFGLESCSMYDEKSMHKRNPDWHRLTGAIPFPNRMKDIQEIIDRQGVCLCKTHAKPDEHDPVPAIYEGFEGSIPIRAIYVLRDGREACVSYWHYLREIPKLKLTLADVIRGDFPFGSWSDHVKAWEPRMRACTTYLRYECALKDIRICLRLVLAPHASWDGLNKPLCPWQDFQTSDPTFFRSGSNDTWRTEMIGDDLALFYDLHGDTMQEYGYDVSKELEYAST